MIGARMRRAASGLAVPGGGEFSPADLPNLALWLKADSLSLTDNDPVTAWPDDGPDSLTIEQATSARRPVFKTNVINGLPAVRFTKASQHHLYGPTNTLRMTRQTIFAVLLTTNGTSNSEFLTKWRAGSSDFGDLEWRHGWAIDSSPARRAGAIWYATSSFDNLFSGTDFTVGEPFLYTFRHDQADTPTIIRQDQTQVASDASPSPTFTLTSKNTNNRLWVGSARDGLLSFDGDLAELIICDGDESDSDVAAAETYLTDKWGL